jgi:hypothetical protein
LRKKVCACFDAAAVSTGCRLEYFKVETEGFKEQPFANMVNNSIMADVYRNHASKMGKRLFPKEV